MADAVKNLNTAWNSLRMLFIKAQLIKLRPLFKISLYKPNLMPAEGSCQAREGKLKSVCSGFRTMRSQSILKRKKKKGVCAFYVHQIASFLPIQSELCTYSRIFNLHKRYFCLFNLIYQKGKKKKAHFFFLSLTLWRNSERTNMSQNHFWLSSMVTKLKEEAVFWVNGLASNARCLLKGSQALRGFLCLPCRHKHKWWIFQQRCWRLLH